jgi:hypothetical protein
MCKNPADRLGVSTEGYAQLISHPWFRDIDWKQIEQQTAEPPFSPDVSLLISMDYIDNICSPYQLH